MTDSKHRFFSKLAVINYNMLVHEGNANMRLASQAGNILSLWQDDVPQRYRKDFVKLNGLLEKTVEKLPGLMIPVRVKGIRNRSAVNFIKLLWEIEETLREEED